MGATIVGLCKDAAAVVGAITAVIALCGLVSKGCRNGLSKIVRKFAGADENTAKLDQILAWTDRAKEIEAGLVVGLRYRLREIYYQYVTTGELPLRDKETFIDIYYQYKRLGGNHQADVWYEELKQAKLIDALAGDDE